MNNKSILNKKVSVLTNQSTGLQQRRDNRFRRDVVKAKVTLAITIGFIACHSIKWVNNILEIKMVSIF